MRFVLDDERKGLADYTEIVLRAMNDETVLAAAASGSERRVAVISDELIRCAHYLGS